MSTYIRRYAKYLNEKAFSYRQMAFDFCKVKRGLVELLKSVLFVILELLQLCLSTTNRDDVLVTSELFW